MKFGLALIFLIYSFLAHAEVEVNPCDMYLYSGALDCHYQIEKSDYTIFRNGIIKYSSNEIKLRLPNGYSIAGVVDGIAYGNNTLISLEISDGEDSGTLIASFLQSTGKLNWLIEFPAFNCSKILIYKDELFLGGIGRVSKYNAKSGTLVWSIGDLYNSETLAFNGFKTAAIVGENVVFTESKSSYAKYSGERTVVVNIKSGSVLSK